MKRISLSIVGVLLTVMSTVAQVIKLDAGAAFSSMQDDTPLHQFTGNNTGFSALLGIDWLEHEYFYLSSQVGYMATGGTDHIYLTNEQGVHSDILDWHMRRDNFHINTTFRARVPFGRFHAYIGVGPKLDIPLNARMSDNLNMEYASADVPFFQRDVMFGVKTELGLVYDFEYISLGVNFSFLPDITRQASYLNQTTRNNTFTLGVSLGYML
ncbi:MAG: hypothetical protein IKM35_02300 [Bacteroidaceae bacterium]|nr:hypothetical protein [Bacteroidaceae bacterium]